MLEIILITDIVIAVLCVFLRNRGKAAVAIGIIYTMAAFIAATSTYDSFAYSNAFNAICRGETFDTVVHFGYGIDYGFLILMKICSVVTKDYIFFRFIVYLIGGFFLLKSIRSIDQRSLLPIILYMLFPFQFDTFQIEFFLGYSVIAYGVTLLVEDKERSVIKYIICVIIATLVHKYCVLFGAFLLFKLNMSQLRKLITALVIVFIGLNLFLRINLIALVNRVIPGINVILNLGHYVEGDQLNILTIILSIGTLLLVYYYSYQVYREQAMIESPVKTYNNLFLINSVSLLFLPFIFTSLNFERYFRPLLIINYALIDQTAVLGNKKLRYLEFAIVALLLFRFWLHWDYCLANNSDILKNLLGIQVGWR